MGPHGPRRHSTPIPEQSIPTRLNETFTIDTLKNIHLRREREMNKALSPWTSLVCLSNPKCVFVCVTKCVCVCVTKCVKMCVSPNASAENATELASLTYLCSLRSHVFFDSPNTDSYLVVDSCANADSCPTTDSCLNTD